MQKRHWTNLHTQSCLCWLSSRSRRVNVSKFPRYNWRRLPLASPFSSKSRLPGFSSDQKVCKLMNLVWKNSHTTKKMTSHQALIVSTSTSCNCSSTTIACTQQRKKLTQSPAALRNPFPSKTYKMLSPSTSCKKLKTWQQHQSSKNGKKWIPSSATTKSNKKTT